MLIRSLFASHSLGIGELRWQYFSTGILRRGSLTLAIRLTPGSFVYFRKATGEVKVVKICVFAFSKQCNLERVVGWTYTRSGIGRAAESDSGLYWLAIDARDPIVLDARQLLAPVRATEQEGHLLEICTEYNLWAGRLD